MYIEWFYRNTTPCFKMFSICKKKFLGKIKTLSCFHIGIFLSLYYDESELECLKRLIEIVIYRQTIT